jgi:hypothetical protein
MLASMDDLRRPRDSGQSIEDAIERETVSFSQQFTALYRQYRVPDDEKAHWADIYKRARTVFEDNHDGVVRSWYADPFAAGVALTGDGELHEDAWLDDLDYDTTEAARFWGELRTLRDRVDVNLPSRHADRRVCLRGVFDLFAGLIVAMVGECRSFKGDPTPSEQFGQHLELLSQQRDALEPRYLEFVRAHAHHVYLAGALLGLIPVAVALAVVWYFLGTDDAYPWVPVMAAGALGAILSVLQRMTSGKLDVQIEAERRDLRIGGSTRPAVGVLSALAVYVIVEADLVLIVPSDPTVKRYFFVAIAFFAGFSERFVKDAFSTAEGTAAGTPAVQSP